RAPPLITATLPANRPMSAYPFVELNLFTPYEYEPPYWSNFCNRFQF
ncbi:hypothetical protein ATK86_7362, partial [Nocardia fluminea]